MVTVVRSDQQYPADVVGNKHHRGRVEGRQLRVPLVRLDPAHATTLPRSALPEQTGQAAVHHF